MQQRGCGHEHDSWRNDSVRHMGNTIESINNSQRQNFETGPQYRSVIPAIFETGRRIASSSPGRTIEKV